MLNLARKKCGESEGSSSVQEYEKECLGGMKAREYRIIKMLRKEVSKLMLEFELVAEVDGDRDILG